MRNEIIIITVVFFCLFSVLSFASDDFLLLEPSATSGVATLLSSTPTTDILFTHPDGRTAKIDFGGEEVVYSGDLPVDESAKLFFEAFGYLFDKRCDELKNRGK